MEILYGVLIAVGAFVSIFVISATLEIWTKAIARGFFKAKYEITNNQIKETLETIKKKVEKEHWLTNRNKKEKK